MYLNFNVYPEQLLPEDLYYLLAIKLVKTDIDIPEDVLSRFETLSLVKYIKGTKNEEERLKLRLSDKGKELFNRLGEVKVSEETEIIFTWLSNYYKKLGKEVGSANKTKLWIENFSQLSGIKRNNLVNLCKAFVESDEDAQWSYKLEYLFFKPSNVYNTRFSLENSKLYNFYLKNKLEFDSKILIDD